MSINTKEVLAGISQGITEQSIKEGKLPNPYQIASMILVFAYAEIANILRTTLETSTEDRVDLAAIFEEESTALMLGKIN